MPDIEFARAALAWAWSNRVDILGTLRTVREWFRSEPDGRGILIIGPGGAGKTTLARILSGEFDWLLDDPWKYNENFGVEEVALKDDPKVKLVVPPGQIARRATTWGEIERDLSAGRYRGVIVVGAHGFHAMPYESYKDHNLYSGGKDSFVKSYLQACRDDEIAVVERITSVVQPAPGKLWFMSVIAKEDLWWPDRREVEASYLGGPYAAAIQRLRVGKGDQNFRHEYVPASLVISNLTTDKGEFLAKTIAGYDHRQQVQSLRRLFEVLEALKKWEAGP